MVLFREQSANAGQGPATKRPHRDETTPMMPIEKDTSTSEDTSTKKRVVVFRLNRMMVNTKSTVIAITMQFAKKKAVDQDEFNVADLQDPDPRYPNAFGPSIDKVRRGNGPYYQATALSVLGLNGSNGGNGSSGRQQIGNVTDGRSCR